MIKNICYLFQKRPDTLETRIPIDREDQPLCISQIWFKYQAFNTRLQHVSFQLAYRKMISCIKQQASTIFIEIESNWLFESEKMVSFTLFVLFLNEFIFKQENRIPLFLLRSSSGLGDMILPLRLGSIFPVVVCFKSFSTQTQMTS